MSQLLINKFLKDLDILRKITGKSRETQIREAFKDMLKAWGRSQDLIFVAEYDFVTATKKNRQVDGVLLYELRVPLGYWEAKDTEDDIDAAIAAKLRDGYPQDNIIFENSETAVLWQNRQEIKRCQVNNVDELEELLKLSPGAACWCFRRWSRRYARSDRRSRERICSIANGPLPSSC